MKSLRLLALALLTCACTAAAALACDAHKSQKNTAAAATPAKVTSAAPAVAGPATHAKHAGHAGCSAEMAARCTPEMMAACKSNAAVAAAMGCEAKGATTAAAAGCEAKGATAATAAVAAGHARAKSAAGPACCAMKGSAAAFAANARGGTTAAGARADAHDCAACADWASCEEDVRTLNAKAQVVSLKNGAMIVYTADSPGSVKALQATVAKRHERLVAALSAGGSQKLCPDCRALRGAIASGKLHREVVNVERGCMTLLTSNDASVVTRIRAMTGQTVAMR